MVFYLLAITQVHKRMTSEQLRSIFHVESQDLVPNYEVIHLTHHGTTEHQISKRSIASASQQNHQFGDASAQQKFSSHHVKKDLSKSAYYSELKSEISSLPVSSSSSSSSTKWTASKSKNSLGNKSNSINNSFNSDSQSKLVKINLSDSELDEQNENQQYALPSVPQRRDEHDENDENDDSDSYEQTKRHSFANLDLANIKEHNVSLSVFGQVFNLTLRPTDQLFKNGPQSLQMFTVNASPNSTHGLDYEPVKDVSVLLIFRLIVPLFCHFAFEFEFEF